MNILTFPIPTAFWLWPLCIECRRKVSAPSISLSSKEILHYAKQFLVVALHSAPSWIPERHVQPSLPKEGTLSCVLSFGCCFQMLTNAHLKKLNLHVKHLYPFELLYMFQMWKCHFRAQQKSAEWTPLFDPQGMPCDCVKAKCCARIGLPLFTMKWLLDVPGADTRGVPVCPYNNCLC